MEYNTYIGHCCCVKWSSTPHHTSVLPKMLTYSSPRPQTPKGVDPKPLDAYCTKFPFLAIPLHNLATMAEGPVPGPPIASCSRPLSHSSLRLRSLSTSPSSSATLALAVLRASSSTCTRISALSARSRSAFIARSASSAFLRCCSCSCSSCAMVDAAEVEAAARSRAPACASRTSVARPCSSSRMYAASCARSRSSSASCRAVSSTLSYVEVGDALVPGAGARCFRRARSAAGSDGAVSLSLSLSLSQSTFVYVLCQRSRVTNCLLFLMARDPLCWWCSYLS